MVNKVSKDVKAILEKVKVLAELKKAMKEELSRVQEALENMTEKEFQLLGAMKAGVKMTKEELEKNKLVETNPGLLDDATCISINKPILHKCANENVSLGSQFTNLEVEHIDKLALLLMVSIGKVVF